MKLRSYHDLTCAIVSALPSREETAALSEEQIESLRRLGNTYDNALYLDLLKRREKQPIV